jgi:hypothetical protein
MKITKKQLKRIIKEELEVTLTNEEAGEMFGEDIQSQLNEGPGEEEAEARTGAAPPGGERDVQKIIAFLPKINNKVEYEELLIAVTDHAENVMGSGLILKKLYKSLPALVKAKGK